jgi:tripartite ATP-independent transporter DctP family solute receptor
MKTFGQIIIVIAVCLSVSVSVFSAELVMEVGTFHPPGTGDVEGLNYFKEIVEERSNGNIQVNVYFGKTLGGELDTIDQCRLGTLHAVIDGMGTMGRYAKKYGTWSLPYAYPDQETLLASVKGPIGQAIKAEMDKNGLIFVGIFPLGYRNMTSNREAIEPATIKGMKLRLPKNPDWITVWSEFGVIPTPVPAPEMFLALQTGLVEAQENPFTTIHVRKLWEVQKYMVLTQHVIDFHLMMLSKAFMEKVPEEYKDLILQAAEDTLVWCGEYTKGLIEKYRAEAEENGMKILTPNKEAYREIAMQAWDKLKEQWEPWVYDQLIKETAK